MSWFEGVGIIGLVVCIALLVALFILVAFCFWWFAGYLCATFGWYAMDQNSQIVTWVVLMTIGSGAARSGSSK
jgi:uncharacterized membrane protein